MKKFAVCSLATEIRGFWNSASHQRLPIGTGYLAGWHSFRILSALYLSAHFNILEFAGHDMIPLLSNLIVISVGAQLSAAFTPPTSLPDRFALSYFILVLRIVFSGRFRYW